MNIRDIRIWRFGLPYNPKKERRKQKKIIRQIILFVVIILILAAALAFGVAILIRKTIKGWAISDTVDSIWISSLASYWGGIVGGFLSGVLALLGVYFTIKYYKETDEEKEKAAIQPFLLIKNRKDSDPSREFHLKKNGWDVEQEEAKPKKMKQERVYVSIKNIGNGFATTLTVLDGIHIGGLAYQKVLTIGAEEPLMLTCYSDELAEGVSFGIQYIDSKRNEYVQEYTLKKEYGTVQIDCGYPQFLEQN